MARTGLLLFALALPGLAAAAAENGGFAAGEMTLGSPDAKVTVIEYASMTCPHCAAFHAGTFKQLKEKYIDTGKVRFVFREFPFDRLALRASMLARCAGENGYFAMLDVLFGQQESWARAEEPMQALAKIGRLGGVSQQEFDACMANELLANVVVQNRQIGESEHNVDSTPSFVIAGEKLSGNLPLSEFDAVIGKHLQ